MTPLNDKEYKQIKTRIMKLVTYWSVVMGLDSWDQIDCEWVNIPADEVEGTGGAKGVAEAYTSWQYMQATISFRLPSLYGLSDTRLEYIVVHELCHLLVAEMRAYARDLHKTDPDEFERLKKHEERVVSSMAMAFIRTVNTCYGWIPKAGKHPTRLTKAQWTLQNRKPSVTKRHPDRRSKVR